MTAPPSVVGMADDGRKEDPRRSRRGTDQLALRIFEILRPLAEEDKRRVLSAIDAVEGPGGPSSERATLARASVERFLAEAGGPPSKRRYEEWRISHSDNAIPSATFVSNTFGSWAKAMDALGLKPTADIVGYRLRSLGSGPTNEEVIADLRRCGRELGKKRLLFREYREWARGEERAGRAANTLLISPNSFITRFGSFATALRLAGLETALNGPRTRSSENTGERLIACLRRAAADERIDRITLERYDGWRERGLRAGHAIPAGGTIAEHFGGWRRALSAAGLSSSNEERAGYGRGRGRKVSLEHMARCLLEAAHRRGMPLTIGSYRKWRAMVLDDLGLPPPPSESVIQNRIAPWSTIKELLEEAIREDDQVASLVEDLRAEEALRAR